MNILIAHKDLIGAEQEIVRPFLDAGFEVCTTKAAMNAMAALKDTPFDAMVVSLALPSGSRNLDDEVWGPVATKGNAITGLTLLRQATLQKKNLPPTWLLADDLTDLGPQAVEIPCVVEVLAQPADYRQLARAVRQQLA